MTEEQKILRMLKERLAVPPSTAARVLGIGRWKTKAKIKDGTIPVTAAGTVPSDWVREQLAIVTKNSAA